MEKLYYYGEGTQSVEKIDAPVLSTTTGVYNAIYGAQVWSLLNQEANAFGVLPKFPWSRSGWRNMSARAGSTADGGVAEGGALPDSIKPTFEEVSTKPKTVAHVFEVSEVQQFLTETDDAIGDLEMMRGMMGVKHKEAINQQLLAAVEAGLAGNNFESIDRVCCSKAEVTDCSITSNYGDIYGWDRDSATTHDAYVDENSNTDRYLTDDMLRGMLTTLQQNGANPTIWLTGWDTFSRIVSLYDPQVRYNVVGETMASVGVNGINTQAGFGFGVKVSTLYNIPLIISKDVYKDTISRIYLLDTSDPEGYGVPRMGIAIARPTQYFEAGIDKGDPFPVAKFTTKGMYRTMGELICRVPQYQGKIRDLK